MRLFRNTKNYETDEYYFIPENDIETFADGAGTFVQNDEFGELVENVSDILAIDGEYMFEDEFYGFETGSPNLFDGDGEPLEYADLESRYEGHVYHDGRNHQFITFSDQYGKPTDFKEVEPDDSFPCPGDDAQCIKGLDARDGLYITIWQAPDGSKWRKTVSVWQGSLPWACWTREED